MIFAVIILGCISVVLFTYLHIYRKQIKNICRQMKFQVEHESNILISQRVFTREISELTDLVNSILREEQEIRIQYTELNNALTNTITNLSHDIRTPLTSLNGYFQLLTESTSPEEREHYHRIIKSRIAVLKDILEELFTYAKLQNGDYYLDLRYLDLNKVLCDTIFSFYDDLKAKGTEPRIHIPESEIMVLLNEAAIVRVIQNIIKNSMVHGKDVIFIELKALQDTVKLLIENDMEHPEAIRLDNIFDRFYKADNSRNHISTGLGLSIAKELVEKMNGTIQASVKESLFCVEIEFPR